MIRFKRESLLSLLPMLFYLGNLYRMLSGSMSIYYLIFITAGIIGIIIGSNLNNSDLNKLRIFAFVYLFTMFINWMVIGNTSTLTISLSVLFIGITVLMLTMNWSIAQAGFTYYITFILLALRLYGRTSNVLTISSNNYVSVLILLAAALYYIAVETNLHTVRLVDLLPAILSFLLSVLALGRGGILSSGVLVVGVLLTYIGTITNKHFKRLLVIFVVSFSVAILMIGFGFNIVDWFFSLGRWSTRGTYNTDRLHIWNSYFEKTFESPLYILLGAPKSQIYVIGRYGGNPHNSFIQLHANNGLITLTLFFGFLIQSIIYYLKSHNFLRLSVLIVLIVRGVTDTFIFGMYGMPIMLYLVLYPTIKSSIVQLIRSPN